jgi:nicotinamidase-related amidase
MTARLPPPNAVLLLIDLQKAILHPKWGRRNNLGAEANLRSLLEMWRANSEPVWHVRHDSTDPLSPYRPGQPGNEFLPHFEPLPTERVFAKQTNSAFIGTDLAEQLREQAVSSLVIAGVITNNSVETTARMAGNLGFDAYLVADGCFTFDKLDWNRVLRSAEDIHAMSLANLDGEYCSIVETRLLLSRADR